MKTFIASLVGAIVGVSIFAAGYLARPTTVAPEPQLGAVSGPDISSPYFSVNGLVTYRSRIAMRAATTTLCAIKSPSATSTLTYAGWQIGTGTSTAATIDLATSTTAFATTSNLVAASSVASGAQATVSWVPSTTNGVLAPNTYVVVKTAGVGSGGYTYGGSCSAEFNVL